MFDPLNSTAEIFGGDQDNEAEQPPWPTTPHKSNGTLPNLRRASPALQTTPDLGPSPGLYGKTPQIYGQPEPGLISPRDTVGSNGTKYEKPEPYLRVRITGLDRNRRDILIKLDAQTTLSNFTGTTYRNVSRSYLEFQQFYEAIIANNPQTIVPALPLAQTSAPTDEEDDRLVRIMLQRWITRVCEDPIILHDEDLRSFIESDFGYQPTPRPRRKASSGFAIIRRGVPDEDEELQRARFELTKLEGQFFETAKSLDKLAVTRKSLAIAHAEMGNKLINVATTEAHPPLGNAFRKIGRTWHSLADLDQAQAISECVIVGDSLGYQGMNARSAKETLQQRNGVLEEYQAAVKTTISKRRQIERLKASSNIRPDRVDDALEDMEEANKYEQTLAKRAEGISQNLHHALQTHNRYANDDITTALIEHARSSIMYERQLLRELESLRVDVGNAANKIAPTTNAAPRPSVVPPLEDFTTKPPVLAPTPALPSHMVRSPLPPSSPAPSFQSTTTQDTLSASSSRTFPRPEPTSASSNYSSSEHAHDGPLASAPLPAQAYRQPSRPPQSPGAGPSSATHDQPPLGGRFVDGTSSMFVKPSTFSPLPSPLASATSQSQYSPGPLQRAQAESFRTNSAPNTFRGDPLLDPGPLNGGSRPLTQSTINDLDPLANVRANHMASSVRAQPVRPRLDAREAASKLANMF